MLLWIYVGLQNERELMVLELKDPVPYLPYVHHGSFPSSIHVRELHIALDTSFLCTHDCSCNHIQVTEREQR